MSLLSRWRSWLGPADGAGTQEPSPNLRGRCLALWRAASHRLWEDNVTAMSAALSFRTIFALIPLLALVFLIIKAAGVIEDTKQSLRKVLDASGFSQIALMSEGHGTESSPAGETAEAQPRIVNVADQIESLVTRVESKLTIGTVGPVGAVLLIYTATTLLTAMERSLNRIFRCRQGRSLFRAMPIYWSVLTLGPILLTAGMFAGQRATQVIDQLTGTARFFAGLVGWAGPFIGLALALWAVYKLLPNGEVSWWAALVGAVLAAPAWLIAKWGFAIYVERVVGMRNMYGLLAVLPLFLIWLNLSWLIVLSGAEVAYAIDSRSLGSRARARSQAARPPADLLAALLVIARAYERGEGPVSLRQLGEQLRIPADDLVPLVDLLTRMRLICPISDESGYLYVLRRPAARISVAWLMQGTGTADQPPGTDYAPEVAAAMARYREQLESSLSTVTVADLVAAGSTGGT